MQAVMILGHWLFPLSVAVDELVWHEDVMWLALGSYVFYQWPLPHKLDGHWLRTASVSPSMSLLCHSLLIYPAPPSLPQPVIFFQFLVRLLCLSPCVVGKGRIDLHLLGWGWCTRCPLCLLARHTKILLKWTAEREMPRLLPTVNQSPMALHLESKWVT